MVGDAVCEDLEVKESQITCLPPKSEPFDGSFENPRVMVSEFLDREQQSGW